MIIVGLMNRIFLKKVIVTQKVADPIFFKKKTSSSELEIAKLAFFV